MGKGLKMSIEIETTMNLKIEADKNGVLYLQVDLVQTDGNRAGILFNQRDLTAFLNGLIQAEHYIVEKNKSLNLSKSTNKSKKVH